VRLFLSADPESGDRVIYGKLTLVDDRENAIALRIALTVIRQAATRFENISDACRPTLRSNGVERLLEMTNNNRVIIKGASGNNWPICL